MKVNRKELLDKLGIIAPALADNNLVPMLTHVWLHNGALTAFNDHIAISAPFEYNDDIAVPGSVFIAMLNAAQNNEATLEANAAGSLVFKCGTMRGTLAVMREDFDSMFQMPDVANTQVVIAVTDELKEAFATCAKSSNPVSHRSESQGITIVSDGTSVSTYGTDGISIVRVTVAGIEANPCQVIVPRSFCEELLRLSKGNTEPPILYIEENKFALVEFADDVKLYGRIINSESPIDFEHLLELHAGATGEPIPLPKQFNTMLRRAIVVTGTATDIFTNIVVIDGKLRSLTQSPLGEMRDVIAFEHPDVASNVRPDLLLRYADDEKFNRIALDEAVTLLVGDDRVFMAASKSDRKQKE